MGVGRFVQERGGGAFATQPLKPPFLFWSAMATLTTAPPALPVCPAGGYPSPQRPRTDCKAQAAAQTVPDARQTARSRPHTGTHARTLDTLHRSASDTRQAAPGRSGRRRGWAACNPSIMCIMIALSQAWYIDSILYKYHTNILLHLVIVNYYLSIDI